MAKARGLFRSFAQVFCGVWQVPRPDDPRFFVIVEPPTGKTLVYWGTPRRRDTWAPLEWPRVYRERNEIQENSFKRMIDHGALSINYGRKTIVGADRHQQRARSKLEQALEGAQQRIERKAQELEAQQDKVAESEQRGHGKRLEQRQQALAKWQAEVQAVQEHQNRLREQADALGPPKERRDRDFRKQTIMTVRTLWLENALLAFIGVLVGHLPLTVSRSCLLTLRFERSGMRLETACHVIYEVNGAGLSVAYRRLMTAVIKGVNAMELTEQGKLIQVRLKDRPP